jgi:hypothetical protein
VGGAARQGRRPVARRRPAGGRPNRIGSGGSGRNSGFVVASLTHGIANGLARFPREMATLEWLRALDRLGLGFDS